MNGGRHPFRRMRCRAALLSCWLLFVLAQGLPLLADNLIDDCDVEFTADRTAQVGPDTGWIPADTWAQLRFACGFRDSVVANLPGKVRLWDAGGGSYNLSFLGANGTFQMDG